MELDRISHLYYYLYCWNGQKRGYREWISPLVLFVHWMFWLRDEIVLVCWGLMRRLICQMIRWYLRWYYFKEETKGIDVSTELLLERLSGKLKDCKLERIVWLNWMLIFANIDGIDRDNAVVGWARFGEMLPRNRMEHERGTCSSIGWVTISKSYYRRIVTSSNLN